MIHHTIDPRLAGDVLARLERASKAVAAVTADLYHLQGELPDGEGSPAVLRAELHSAIDSLQVADVCLSGHFGTTRGWLRRLSYPASDCEVRS
ncbi:MAG: hypothetical protein ACRDQZ_03475 [Mycobacteriales bacterium]